MQDPTDSPILGIRLKLIVSYQDSISTKLLMQILRAVEGGLAEVDRDFLEQVATELQAPSLALDAARERLRQHRNGRMWISGCEPGSLVFDGELFLVAWVILNATLGESLREAYRTSETHQRLTEHFRNAMDMDIGNVVHSIIRKILTATKGTSVVAAGELVDPPDGVPAGVLHVDVEPGSEKNPREQDAERRAHTTGDDEDGPENG